jgi:hypothetical protein
MKRRHVGKAAVGADKRVRARDDRALNVKVTRRLDAFRQVPHTMLVHAIAGMVVDVQSR